MAEAWLPILRTATPRDIFELATKPGRLGVKLALPRPSVTWNGGRQPTTSRSTMGTTDGYRRD